MACDDGGTQGGILFHDFRGEAAEDPRRCTHSPADPGRVDHLRSRANRLELSPAEREGARPFALFRADDEPADRHLTARDCEVLRAIRYVRQATRKCKSNGKGLAVVHHHGGAPAEEVAVPLHEYLEVGWRGLEALRRANQETVRRLLKACTTSVTGPAAPAAATPAPPSG